jgi:biopolymer transport protein ExbD
MRLNKHHHPHTLGFNMTPMIDVVFLLIIFFMTVSQISRINAHHVRLPEVSASAHEERPVTLALTIDEQGRIFENGVGISAEAAVAKVQQLLRQANNDPQRILIHIRCDRRAASQTVNGLVRNFSALGIKQIRTAVTER